MKLNRHEEFWWLLVAVKFGQLQEMSGIVSNFLRFARKIDMKPDEALAMADGIELVDNLIKSDAYWLQV